MGKYIVNIPYSMKVDTVRKELTDNFGDLDKFAIFSTDVAKINVVKLEEDVPIPNYGLNNPWPFGRQEFPTYNPPYNPGIPGISTTGYIQVLNETQQ